MWIERERVSEGEMGKRIYLCFTRIYVEAILYIHKLITQLHIRYYYIEECILLCMRMNIITQFTHIDLYTDIYIMKQTYTYTITIC